MGLAWAPEAVEHMWDGHRITPEQAEEALDDPYVLVYRPDPSSKSGKSDRHIGECSTCDVLVVIVANHEGAQYGANAWVANSRDVKAYWANRERLEHD